LPWHAALARFWASPNIRRSFSGAFSKLSETEIARVVTGMWDNLGRVAAEYPHLEIRGFEHVDRAVAAGRRMIVFSEHIANWEIATLAGIQHGISAAPIYRTGNNPLLGRMTATDRDRFVSTRDP
jgi:KDO2-lipid IV(A) lauroyltransferase